MSVFKDLDISVQEYCKHLQDNYESRGRNNGIEFHYEYGRKYIHIIMNHTGQFSYNQRSSHSWVMIDDDKKFKQGDILKSASWKSPARNFKRGNVITGDFQHIRWCGV